MQHFLDGRMGSGHVGRGCAKHCSIFRAQKGLTTAPRQRTKCSIFGWPDGVRPRRQGLRPGECPAGSPHQAGWHHDGCRVVVGIQVLVVVLCPMSADRPATPTPQAPAATTAAACPATPAVTTPEAAGATTAATTHDADRPATPTRQPPAAPRLVGTYDAIRSGIADGLEVTADGRLLGTRRPSGEDVFDLPIVHAPDAQSATFGPRVGDDAPSYLHLVAGDVLRVWQSDELPVEVDRPSDHEFRRQVPSHHPPLPLAPDPPLPASYRGVWLADPDDEHSARLELRGSDLVSTVHFQGPDFRPTISVKRHVRTDADGSAVWAGSMFSTRLHPPSAGVMLVDTGPTPDGPWLSVGCPYHRYVK